MGQNSAPIKSRIVELIDKKGDTREKILNNIGVSKSNFSGVGLKSEVGGFVLSKILNIYSDVSAEWLLTGIGPMLKEGAVSQESTSKYKVTASTEGAMPLIPVAAMAGFNGVDVDGVMPSSDYDYYKIPGMNGDLLVSVAGESMQPKLLSGDIIACKSIDLSTCQYIQWGRVYVLDSNQGPMVKYLFPDSSNEDVIICHSENAGHFPDFKIPKSDIRKLFLVTGLVRPM